MEVLAGETVGLEQDEQGWRIWFGPVLLARLDREHLLAAAGRVFGARRRSPYGLERSHIEGF